MLNRQRIRRAKGKRFQKLRSERCERTFAHVCETGGMRRSWLKGLVDVTKRYLIATAAHNLGRVLWKLFGVGKPRSLQGCGGLGAIYPIILTVLQSLKQRMLTSAAEADGTGAHGRKILVLAG